MSDNELSSDGETRSDQIKMEFFPCTNCFENYNSEFDLHNHHCKVDQDNSRGDSPQESKNFSSDVDGDSSLIAHQCQTCSKSFRSSYNLSRHKTSVHQEEAANDSQKFTGVHISPVTSENGKKIFPCPTCNKHFTRNDHLKRHIRVIHDKDTGSATGSAKDDQDKPYECSKCSKAFRQKKFLVKHLRIVHREEAPSFDCQVCHKKFYRIEKLGAHISIVHDKIKIFKCHICLKDFSRSDHLKRHLRSVHEKIKRDTRDDDDPFDDCDTFSNDETNPTPRVRRQPPKEKKVYECPTCLKIFKRGHHLVTHVRSVHDKVKPYACHLCEKKFATNKTLGDHVNFVHQKIKLFKCANCAKDFSRHIDLERHVRSVHQKEKPFYCEQCATCFSLKHNLLRHIETVHEKAKPYECTTCLKKYSTATHLKTHVNSVHAPKPSLCSVCNKAFASLADLQLHQNTEHTQNVYQHQHHPYPPPPNDLLKDFY